MSSNIKYIVRLYMMTFICLTFVSPLIFQQMFSVTICQYCTITNNIKMDFNHILHHNMVKRPFCVVRDEGRPLLATALKPVTNITTVLGIVNKYQILGISISNRY